MPIETSGAIVVQEDRSFLPFSDTQVDGTGGPGCKGDGDDQRRFASLARCDAEREANSVGRLESD